MQLFTLVVTFTVLMVVNAMPREKRAGRSCIFNGYHYASGSTFTYPPGSCFTYGCNDGYVSLAQGACKGNDGRCHNVGSTWQEDCTTYRCSQDHRSYMSLVASVACKDANGFCRYPGETFPQVINGYRYNSCTCSINGNSLRTRCRG